MPAITDICKTSSMRGNIDGTILTNVHQSHCLNICYLPSEPCIKAQSSIRNTSYSACIALLRYDLGKRIDAFETPVSS